MSFGCARCHTLARLCVQEHTPRNLWQVRWAKAKEKKEGRLLQGGAGGNAAAGRRRKQLEGKKKIAKAKQMSAAEIEADVAASWLAASLPGVKTTVDGRAPPPSIPPTLPDALTLQVRVVASHIPQDEWSVMCAPP